LPLFGANFSANQKNLVFALLSLAKK